VFSANRAGGWSRLCYAAFELAVRSRTEHVAVKEAAAPTPDEFDHGRAALDEDEHSPPLRLDIGVLAARVHADLAHKMAGQVLPPRALASRRDL
jgi:hypothetical protein